MSEDNTISDADFAKTIRLFVAARGTARLAQEFEVTDGAVARWSQGKNLPQPRIRTEVCAWVEEHLKGSYHDAPPAERGWRFVPVPGAIPLPRIQFDDECSPLYVRLVKVDDHPLYCWPHYYIEFGGDDGEASVWAPIESRAFLLHVLEWVYSTGGTGYGETLDHVWKALEDDVKHLQWKMTRHERGLQNERLLWQRPGISAWCCGE